MNIRIEGNDLRFKISRLELESLDRGDVLRQSTSLDTHQIFELSIISRERLDRALELKAEPSNWTLLVDTQIIKDLMSTKPTRKGVNVQQGTLNLTLQVDIRRSR